jgi:DNA end-binding protein Ku
MLTQRLGGANVPPGIPWNRPVNRTFFRHQQESAMAPRANWKGYLKLSLVSCAVALFPATTTATRTRFNILNRATGNRVRNLVVDAETGEPVEEADRVKGHRTKGGDYVLVEDEELEKVALESTHTIEIERFVPRDEVDSIFLDESFFITPDDKVAVEAYSVIRKAMQETDMVGLARVVLYRRERLLMLQPRGKGLMATAIRYRNEVRDETEYFEDIDNVRIPSDMLDLAVHILKGKAGRFDPSEFEDRYEQALTALIKAKRAGKEPPTPRAPEPSNVISLMDALRRSLKAERGGGASSRRRPSRAKASGRKRTTAQRTRMKRAS